MFVLLQEDVPSLGHIGDLVKVADGYANNYLLPKKLAVLADKANKSKFEHLQRMADVKKAKALTAAKELATIISNVSLTITKPVGEENKIFGSVTTMELATALEQAGHKVDRHSISLSEDIKRLGVYKGLVKLHPEVHAEFNIWVVAAQA